MALVHRSKIINALRGKVVKSGMLARSDGSRCAFGELLHAALVSDEDMNKDRDQNSPYFDRAATVAVREGLKDYGIEFRDLDGGGDPLPLFPLTAADNTIRDTVQMTESVIERFIDNAIMPYLEP